MRTLASIEFVHVLTRRTIISVTFFHVIAMTEFNNPNAAASATLHEAIQLLQCNVERSTDFSILSEFVLPDYPIVFTDMNRSQSSLANLGSRNNLLSRHGDVLVDLTSSNTYSEGRYRMTLAEFISDYVDAPTADAPFFCENNNDGESKNICRSPQAVAERPANESLYLFGNNYHVPLFKEMTKIYQWPRCRHCFKAGLASVGLGGLYSGVGFHFHGPGFSECVIGHKLWLLYPPGRVAPLFNPNLSTAQWVTETLLKRVNNDSNSNSIDANNLVVRRHNNHITTANRTTYNDDLQLCVIGPGDLLYFPDRWLHATLNLDSYNFFVSIFLDTQRMKD